MSVRAGSQSPEHIPLEGQDENLSRVLQRLIKGGPEQQAVDAGEIDAIIDYSDSNVLLFPAARQALQSIKAKARAHVPVANHLLAALTHDEYQQLAPSLEPVTLRSGTILHEPGEPFRFVYFPVDCIVSLLPATTGRQNLEVGLVGFDGMVGTSLALGVKVSSLRARVQIEGAALRVPQAHFTRALERSQTLRHELNLYIYAELVTARKKAVCSKFHLIEARLASRLLLTSALMRSDRFFVTQEAVAAALGVRRESVTQAAVGLQRKHLITYSRGRLRILNPQGLDAASCSCYERLDTLSNHV